MCAAGGSQEGIQPLLSVFQEVPMADSVNTSKHQRCKIIKAGKEDGDDKLSHLPDGILCHILSFLPTKYACGTSILSKKWEFLWTSLDCYDFDPSLVFHAESDAAWRAHRETFFNNFVSRVLNHGSVSPIKKLCLKSSQSYNFSSSLNEWINTALKRRVQDLDLDLSSEDIVEFPKNLFGCQTLVSLTITSRFRHDFPATIWFPRLKILRVNSVRFQGDVFEPGCPVLEELYLENVFFYENPQRICLRSSILKKLNITLGKPVILAGYTPYKVCVETPQLVDLTISYCYSNGFELNELPFLLKASVNISEWLVKPVTSDCVELLQKISNVTNLQLFQNFHSMNFCRALESSLLLFNNMTHLEIHRFKSWESIFKLLQCSPNLEVLICQKVICCTHKYSRCITASVCVWNPPEIVPNCLTRLAIIEIKGFGGCENEMKIVRYLLKNATRLEKMTICHFFQIGKKWELNFIKEILMFSRGSITCQVAFAAGNLD